MKWYRTVKENKKGNREQCQHKKYNFPEKY